MHVYGMSTTIRLSSAQKRKLQEAQAILQKQSTRKISQGKAVVALAEFALRNRVLLVRAFEGTRRRSEEHTSELQSHHDLVCRLLLEKKKQIEKHEYMHLL